jgi:hypothetical protein
MPGIGPAVEFLCMVGLPRGKLPDSTPRLGKRQKAVFDGKSPFRLLPFDQCPQMTESVRAFRGEATRCRAIQL